MSEHSWQRNLAEKNSFNTSENALQPVEGDEQFSSDTDCVNFNEEQCCLSSSDSDCEEETSLDFNSNLRKISPLLFRNENLEPLTFVLMLHDYYLESKAEEIIVKGGGLVYSTIKEMDIYSIVLVKDDSLFRAHLGPVFKFQYLLRCIKKNKIVSINQYMKTFNNAPALHKFDFMNVFYFKSVDWNEVPEHIKLNKPLGINQTEENAETSYEKYTASSSTKGVMLGDDSEDSSLEIVELSAPVQKKPGKNKVVMKVNKHTRMPYSSIEDAKIVKYIVDKQSYDLVRGTLVWKNMEDSNICPNRTWQSMKEHFLKKVLYQVDFFNFLTNEQKRKFRKLLN